MMSDPLVVSIPNQVLPGCCFVVAVCDARFAADVTSDELEELVRELGHPQTQLLLLNDGGLGIRVPIEQRGSTEFIRQQLYAAGTLLHRRAAALFRVRATLTCHPAREMAHLLGVRH